MNENEQKVLDSLKATGPIRPGDLAAATGIEKELVSKILKNLKKEGLVHSPKQCFYAVKED